MNNFDPPIAAEIDGGFGGPQQISTASLLQRRRSTEANQTLHDVWLSPGLLTVYTFSAAVAP